MTHIRTALTSITIALGITIVTLAAVAAGPSSLTEALSGRYSKHFVNGMVDGERYDSDDVVEIVPVAEDAAYIRASLQFANGHACDISGVAEAEKNQLVYREPVSQSLNGQQCVLRLSRVGSKLQLDDGAGSCHEMHCGMRGTLTWALPFESQRPIRYMARLKASSDYIAALKEWHAKQ
ncbi:hypothetical protein [Acidisphaera sp. S103]|uniref:hypothetical protein n=1 Tax=Acidisphaera sp. S103 TaxID=1747223 RepID=UPI00131B7B84|nr:hypothetical protein [Acidisphaera sp. S103]